MCVLLDSNASAFDKNLNLLAIYKTNESRIDQFIITANECYGEALESLKTDYNELVHIYNKTSDACEVEQKIPYSNMQQVIAGIKNLNKINRKAYKKYKKQEKDLASVISSEKSEDSKLDPRRLIRLKHVAFLFPSLAILGGYFYEHTLLACFYINSNAYFSAIDYISSSFNQLVSAFFIAVAYAIVDRIMYIELSRRHKRISERAGGFLKLAACGYVLLAGTMIVGGYFRNDKFCIIVGCWILVTLILPLFVSRYVKWEFRKSVSGLVLVILCFVVYIFFMSYYKADIIKSSNNKATEKIYFKKMGAMSRRLDANKLIKITSNSRYYFFYDLENKGSLIIPADFVAYIRVDS